MAGPLNSAGPEPAGATKPWWPGAAVALVWALLTAFWISGQPPCVDLPAHGAQMMTLAGLLRHLPDVTATYEWHLPSGYALIDFICLPLVWLTNGAVAVRVALWVTLQLFLLALVALANAWQRPWWFVVLALPMAINISYWYGLLSGLFAQPFFFFCLSAAHVSQRDPRRRWLALAALAALVTMQSHLLAFVVLIVALVTDALMAERKGLALRNVVFITALPGLLASTELLTLATRSISPGSAPATHYDFFMHFRWFVQHMVAEGRLTVAVPLGLAVVSLFFTVRDSSRQTRSALAITTALTLMYLVTPQTVGGIFLVSQRMPVFFGVTVLLASAPQRWPRWLLGASVVAAVSALTQATLFHLRFKQAVAGLEEISTLPIESRHGAVSLVGREILGSHHPYLDHLGQWVTAQHGGRGHNFFADAEHHPVQFKPGHSVPADLWSLNAADLAAFDELFVFGDRPLPPSLSEWKLAAHAGDWRRLTRSTTAPTTPSP